MSALLLTLSVRNGAIEMTAIIIIIIIIVVIIARTPTLARTLRSASDTLSLQIPQARLSTVGSRAFSVFGPSTWNDPPLPVRHNPSLGSFRSDLKMSLFPKQPTASFSAPRCCLPLPDVHVCCLFKLCVN